MIDERKPSIIPQDDIVPSAVVVADIQIEDDHSVDIFRIPLKESGKIARGTRREKRSLSRRLLPSGKEIPPIIKRLYQDLGTA